MSKTQFEVRASTLIIKYTLTSVKRIMGYITSGKNDGATVHLGGKQIGQEGYFIEPTIFTECQPDMKIVREEIFGPVACVMKFSTEDGEIVLVARSSYPSLTTFQRLLNRLMTRHTDLPHQCSPKISTERSALHTLSKLALHGFVASFSHLARSWCNDAWQINCANQTEISMPFGGFKQSGIGRELSEYALEK